MTLSKESNIDISGIEKPVLLAALYNASKQQGLGFMHDRGATGMTEEQAADEIERQGYSFDYLHGRVMKVDIRNDDLSVWLYDRDNGQGAAAKVVASLRESEAA